MFKSFWGSEEHQAQPIPQEISANSWYPTSVISSSSSSRPATPSSSSLSGFDVQTPADRPQSKSHVSPVEAAKISVLIKDKSLDELRKLLSDKDAYCQLLLSLDQVKIQNNLREELQKETVQLARVNLEKEPRIMELQNQCRIIRTTELAAAREKLTEIERQKEVALKFYSPKSLLRRLHAGMDKMEEESEALQQKLLDGGIDAVTFVQKYKSLRSAYHKRALIHLAAKTSFIG